MQSTLRRITIGKLSRTLGARGFPPLSPITFTPSKDPPILARRRRQMFFLASLYSVQIAELDLARKCSRPIPPEKINLRGVGK